MIDITLQTSASNTFDFKSPASFSSTLIVWVYLLATKDPASCSALLDFLRHPSHALTLKDGSPLHVHAIILKDPDPTTGSCNFSIYTPTDPIAAFFPPYRETDNYFDFALLVSPHMEPPQQPESSASTSYYWLSPRKTALSLCRTPSAPVQLPRLPCAILQDLPIAHNSPNPPITVPLFVHNILNGFPTEDTPSILSSDAVAELLKTLKLPPHLNIPPHTQLSVHASYTRTLGSTYHHRVPSDLSFTFSLPSPLPHTQPFKISFSYETTASLQDTHPVFYQSLSSFLLAYQQLLFLHTHFPALHPDPDMGQQSTCWQLPSFMGKKQAIHWMHHGATQDNTQLQVEFIEEDRHTSIYPLQTPLSPQVDPASLQLPPNVLRVLEQHSAQLELHGLSC